MATSSGRAFVFVTSGLPQVPIAPFTRPLVRLLETKGFDVEATVTCRAFDTGAPLTLIGGTNKRRPNEADLSGARTLARRPANRPTTAP